LLGLRAEPGRGDFGPAPRGDFEPPARGDFESAITAVLEPERPIFSKPLAGLDPTALCGLSEKSETAGLLRAPLPENEAGPMLKSAGRGEASVGSGTAVSLKWKEGALGVSRLESAKRPDDGVKSAGKFKSDGPFLRIAEPL